jgi:hypothetical protein
MPFADRAELNAKFPGRLMEVTGLVASIAACLSSAFLDGTCTPHAALQHYNTSLLLPSYSPLTYLSPTLDKPQCQVHASSPALLYIQRGLQGDACVILIPYEAVPGAWVASIDTSSNLKEEGRERRGATYSPPQRARKESPSPHLHINPRAVIQSTTYAPPRQIPVSATSSR